MQQQIKENETEISLLFFILISQVSINHFAQSSNVNAVLDEARV